MIEIDLRERDDGVVIPVRAVPRSSKTQIDGVIEGAVRIRISAPPVDGAANQALAEFIARTFGVANRDVEIVAGQRGKRKAVFVRGVNAAEVRARLET